jgi:15-cis-phytoene desaturase
MSDVDVLVIGGGLAGLSVGALLTKQGFTCAVLEKLENPGGRTRVDERDGFVLDYGIHNCRYADQGAFGALFSKLGIPLQFLPIGKTRYFHDGRLGHFPEGILGILSSRIISTQAKFRLIPGMVKALTAKLNPADYSTSVAEWLKKENAFSPDVAELFRMFCATGLVCEDINRVSFGEFISFSKKYIGARTRAGYPRGGWKNVIGRLIQITETHGVVRTGVSCTRVQIENGMAMGVETPEGEMSGRCVVVALPLQEIDSVLDDGILNEDTRTLIRKLEPTCGITYQVCLSKKVAEPDGVIVTSDPPTMGIFTSNVEPSLAPRGKQLGTWFYPMSTMQLLDKGLINREKTRMRNLIGGMFPGIGNHIEFDRMIVHRMVDGVVPIVGQTWKERPGVSPTDVPNLFFAGDSIGVDGLGGDIAATSAVACAEAATAHLRKF